MVRKKLNFTLCNKLHRYLYYATVQEKKRENQISRVKIIQEGKIVEGESTLRQAENQTGVTS